MGSSSRVQLERKSSIDKEPRTLNFDEMRFAREEALFVIKTRSPEEAERIFTEGLEPVRCVGMKKIGNHALMVYEEEWFEETGTRGLRDVVSAPF